MKSEFKWNYIQYFSFLALWAQIWDKKKVEKLSGQEIFAWLVLFCMGFSVVFVCFDFFGIL